MSVYFYVLPLSHKNVDITASKFVMLVYIPLLFSEHELTFMFAICYHPSVCRL